VLSHLRRHISSAHVIALLALFVALVGSAYATGLLPKNSVGAKQLKRGAVTPAKLAHSTVKKLHGAKGRPGATGATGATGAAGPSDIYAGGAAFGALGASYTEIASITVPPGEYLLGAKVTIFDPEEGEHAIAECQIAAKVSGGPDIWDQTDVSLPKIAGEFSNQNASLAGAAAFSATQTIVFSCKSQFGTTDYDDARVWAIKAGAVHGIPLPFD
jgi:hypothetical protein